VIPPAVVDLELELERDTQALFQLSWEMFADGRQREK